MIITNCYDCPGCGEREHTSGNYFCKLNQRSGAEVQCECPLGEILTRLQEQLDAREKEIWRLESRLDQLERNQ